MKIKILIIGVAIVAAAIVGVVSVDAHDKGIALCRKDG